MRSFPQIPDSWKEAHRRCLSGAVEKNDEDQFHRTDGKLYWVRWEIQPWYQKDGDVGGIVIYSEDISERKKGEEALKVFRAVLDQSSEIIEVIDPHTGRLLDVNETACHSLGYSRDELLSLNLQSLLKRETGDLTFDEMGISDGSPETSNTFEAKTIFAKMAPASPLRRLLNMSISSRTTSWLRFVIFLRKNRLTQSGKS